MTEDATFVPHSYMSVLQLTVRFLPKSISRVEEHEVVDEGIDGRWVDQTELLRPDEFAVGVSNDSCCWR